MATFRFTLTRPHDRNRRSQRLPSLALRQDQYHLSICQRPHNCLRRDPRRPPNPLSQAPQCQLSSTLQLSNSLTSLTASSSTNTKLADSIGPQNSLSRVYYETNHSERITKSRGQVDEAAINLNSLLNLPGPRLPPPLSIPFRPLLRISVTLYISKGCNGGIYEHV